MTPRPTLPLAVTPPRAGLGRVLLCVLLAGLVLIPATVRVSEARRRRAVAPIQVRFLTYVADQGGPGEGHVQWRVALDGDKVVLDIADLTIPSGSYTSLDVDTALAPYRLKFTITGHSDDLKRIRTATRERPVRLSGYLRLDPTARFLMLDRVEPVANNDASATPGSVHNSLGN